MAGQSAIDLSDYVVRLFHERHPPNHPVYHLDKSVHFRLGALVSARYSGDNHWYRARIVAFFKSKGLLSHRCEYTSLILYTSVTV